MDALFSLMPHLHTDSFLASYLTKAVGSFLKTLSLEPSYDPMVPVLSVHVSKYKSSHSNRSLWTHAQSSTPPDNLGAEADAETHETQYMHTVKSCSAEQRATTWMDLENTQLS